MLFRSPTFLLVFHLILSITEIGLLKYSVIIMLLSISPFSFNQCLLHKFETSDVRCAYHYIIFLYHVTGFYLKCILSFVSMAASILLWIPFA